MQTGNSSEAIFFQGLAKQGFGKGTPGTTQQGVYIFTPGGLLLASDNTRDASRFLRAMDQGLQAWARLPESQRGGNGPAKSKRGEDYFPKDGLALRMYSRDLEATTRAIGDQGNLWNTDMVWFSREEMKNFVPSELRVGATRDLPPALPRRLARVHIYDSVLGQSPVFQNNSVRTAVLRSEITGMKNGMVDIRLTGETSASEGDRSIQTRVLGKATFDTKLEKFIAFEMVAVGPRKGIVFRAPYIRNETGSGNIGFAFLLGGDSPADRVAPSHFAGYGW